MISESTSRSNSDVRYRLRRRNSSERSGAASRTPNVMLTAVTVGIWVATVLTAGTVYLGLSAAAATGVASDGSPKMDWWKSKRQGTITLREDAVTFLLGQPSKNAQVETI